MNWYLAALRKYAIVDGRARRKEYWLFTIGNGLLFLALLAFAVKISTGLLFSLLLGLYAFALLVPSVTVTVRRLHDTGRSGWWVLVTFVPVIGPLILLIFTLQDSQPGANVYGPNPKAALA